MLLSNVYLHYVLDLWFERVVKVRLRAKPIWCATSMTLSSDPSSSYSADQTNLFSPPAVGIARKRSTFWV